MGPKYEHLSLVVGDLRGKAGVLLPSSVFIAFSQIIHSKMSIFFLILHNVLPWSVAGKPFLASGCFSKAFHAGASGYLLGPVPFLLIGHSENQKPCATPYVHGRFEGWSHTSCPPACRSSPPVVVLVLLLDSPRLGWQPRCIFRRGSPAQCRILMFLPPMLKPHSPSFNPGSLSIG